MKVFLSHSNANRDVAELIYHSLQNERYDVFFDGEAKSLPPGEEFDGRIREAIRKCDLFVFLASAESLAPRCYALTELAMAQERWKRASGRILPVMITNLDPKALSPYVKTVTALRPVGDLVAEVSLALSRMRRRHRRVRAYQVLLLLILPMIVGGLALRHEGLRQDLTLAIEKKTYPVRLIGMPGNQGWAITFDILTEDPIKEIFYRLEEGATFQSTGFMGERDPRTGLPKPQFFVMIPRSTRKSTILLKYTEPNGREHGPFAALFDPAEQEAAWAKRVQSLTQVPP